MRVKQEAMQPGKSAPEQIWLDSLPEKRVVSIMSGTSVDGADAIVARFHWKERRMEWEVLGRWSFSFPTDLRLRLLRAIEPGGADVVEITQLHAEVGEFYADICEEIAKDTEFGLVSLSGQTLYHIPRIQPERGWRTISTLQVGEPSRVLERVRVPVVSDVRQSDLAAGGQGAPMVSFGDFVLFSESGVNRAIQNLGGIGNVTWLPGDGDASKVMAFDTGPSNCLMDEAMIAFGLGTFDEGGMRAAKGTVNAALLDRLLEHPYLQLGPPKTTGREVFALRENLPDGVEGYAPEDLLATLLRYSARTIGDAYRRWVMPKGLDDVLLAGGGALNPQFVQAIRDELPEIPVRTFEELGWESKDRETLAFGVMAYASVHGMTNTLPSATGARHAVVAGRILRP